MKCVHRGATVRQPLACLRAVEPGQLDPRWEGEKEKGVATAEAVGC